ncbi:hypothetical protein [Pseudomonas putida]|uniref:hypothetical protein n=1 Tax=Pseudomonas putida TaxID=303 RepID=UPI003906099E
MESHRRLTSEQILKVHQSLNASLRHNGADILGSHLGQYVARAVAPKTIKSLGGIRGIVDSDLSDVVEFVESRQSDFLFRITLQATEPVREVIEQTTVNGAQLWRYFSNPNVHCSLGVDTAYQVIVTAPNQPFATPAEPLNRMQVEEYRVLALAFAQEQTDDQFRAELLDLLNDDWMYAKWIECLRTKRAASINYLKSWEIKRTELVISRLREELERVGMNPSQATLVADGVRPPLKKKVTEEPQAPSYGIALEDSQPEDEETKELKELRALLRLAVEHMPLEDLKAIRVPAGIWLALHHKSMD